MSEQNTHEVALWKTQSTFWEKRAKTHEAEATYYRTELAKAHELLGRVIHQTSERWDSVRLTKHYPTDNLHGKRTVNNPAGENK